MNALRTGFLGTIGVLAAIAALYLFIGGGAVIVGFGAGVGLPWQAVALAISGFAIIAVGLLFMAIGNSRR